MRFCYLGAILEQHLGLSQIKLAEPTQHGLNGDNFAEFYYVVNTYCLDEDFFIRQRMLYGTECWATKKVRETKVHVAKMCMLKKDL